MKKHDNLIVNTPRGRKVYERGISAEHSRVALDVALAKWLARNELSEHFTYDDADSFTAGYEYGQAMRALINNNTN